MEAPSAVQSRLLISPITQTIGAEISGVDISGELDPSVVEAIRAAWIKWRVLVFRGQTGLDRRSQVAFARHFGQPTPAHTLAGRPADPDYPEIYVLDFEELKRTYASFQADAAAVSVFPPSKGEGWHTDMSFNADPPAGSILRAISVPPCGGDTLFADLGAAYAALSRPLQDMFSTLAAVHRIEKAQAGLRVCEIEAAAVHPLVTVHPETGERILYVNPGFTSHILGLTRAESDALLKMCAELVTRQEFVLRVRWEPDTVVFWDNRATCHFGPVEMGRASYRRIMNRVTIKGDLLVGADGGTSYRLD